MGRRENALAPNSEDLHSDSDLSTELITQDVMPLFLSPQTGFVTVACSFFFLINPRFSYWILPPVRGLSGLSADSFHQDRGFDGFFLLGILALRLPFLTLSSASAFMALGFSSLVSTFSAFSPSILQDGKEQASVVFKAPQEPRKAAECDDWEFWCPPPSQKYSCKYRSFVALPVNSFSMPTGQLLAKYPLIQFSWHFVKKKEAKKLSLSPLF